MFVILHNRTPRTFEYLFQQILATRSPCYISICMSIYLVIVYMIQYINCSRHQTDCYHLLKKIYLSICLNTCEHINRFMLNMDSQFARQLECMFITLQICGSFEPKRKKDKTDDTKSSIHYIAFLLDMHMYMGMKAILQYVW